MTLIWLACLTGILLGLTCNIFVVFGVCIAGAAACLTAAVVTGHGLQDTATGLVFPAICIQCAYMVGLSGRDTVAQLLARFGGAQSRRA